MKFAQKLERAMMVKGMDRNALIDTVRIYGQSLSNSTLSNYLAGNTKPSMELGLVLARIFDLSYDYLADDSLSEPPANQDSLPPDERAVLSAYRVQRRKEGESFTPEELAWRIMEPRTVAPEVIDGKTGQVKKLNPGTGRYE